MSQVTIIITIINLICVIVNLIMVIVNLIIVIIIIIIICSQGSSKLVVPSNEHQPKTFYQLQKGLGARLQSSGGHPHHLHPYP